MYEFWCFSSKCAGFEARAVNVRKWGGSPMVMFIEGRRHRKRLGRTKVVHSDVHKAPPAGREEKL